MTSLYLLLITPAVLLALFTVLPIFLKSNRRPHRSSRRARKAETQSRVALNSPKPIWVRTEVLRLKALMPAISCRKLAATFNATFQHRGITVGKSWVAVLLKTENYRLAEIRRGIRRRKPKKLPKNLIWGLDLTLVTQNRKPQPVLGIVDHGTRACLALRKLPTKKTIDILKVALEAIEKFGKPTAIRTDNEAIFTSNLFRLVLWALKIRHQRTALHAPWQNGRVERFFGTLKDSLRQLQTTPNRLKENLDLFRIWYNHIRTHDNLDGETPAQAWSQRYPEPGTEPLYFHEWGGVLTGFYFPDG